VLSSLNPDRRGRFLSWSRAPVLRTTLISTEAGAILILTRKEGEIIVVGEDPEIRIMVVDIRGDRVRIGVEAPKNTPIDRLEVSIAKAREKATLARSRELREGLGNPTNPPATEPA
jgi:carbon storage regulator